MRNFSKKIENPLNENRPFQIFIEQTDNERKVEIIAYEMKLEGDKQVVEDHTVIDTKKFSIVDTIEFVKYINEGIPKRINEYNQTTNLDEYLYVSGFQEVEIVEDENTEK